MGKKAGSLCILLGAALMLCALGLEGHNRWEAHRAGQRAAKTMESIQTALATQPTPGVQACSGEETQPLPTLEPELPEVVINGYGYVGYLSIPDGELELPVMARWDYDRLQIAPCRYCGSSRTDDLVIAAHNYSTHFGKLSGLEMGTRMVFTDMEGIENHYKLEARETLAPTAVERVENSGYDLVLYTCTPGGATRVVAFCSRTEEP